jgi:hypothetical protein
MAKPQYEVVSPAGDARDAQAPARAPSCAPPLAGLAGRKLGLVWTAFANGDIVLRAFREHLAKRYPELEFIEMAPGRGLRWGDHPHPSIAELAREHGIDAAVVTAGC